MMRKELVSAKSRECTSEFTFSATKAAPSLDKQSEQEKMPLLCEVVSLLLGVVVSFAASFRHKQWKAMAANPKMAIDKIYIAHGTAFDYLLSQPSTMQMICINN
jgi:hypothetical protein